MSLQHAQIYRGCVPLPPCVFLIKSNGLCRVAAGDILPDITGCRSGWQLCHCCYFSVREARAGAQRSPDHVSDATASKTQLTLEMSRLYDGFFIMSPS